MSIANFEQMTDPSELDLWQLTYYASLNCRYYIKVLAALNTGSDEAYHYETVLPLWESLRDDLRGGELTIEVARGRIADIERLEENHPPDRDLLLEAQHDENESHWGKGIRSHSQVMAEQERRKAAKN